MYDDSITLHMGVIGKKNSSKSQLLELDDPLSYFMQSGQALQDRLHEILDDVETIHKAIKMCVTSEELDSIESQEDQTVIDFSVRITF